MRKLRQVLLVLLKHLVDHLMDFVHRADGGSQWVMKYGLEHQTRVAGERTKTFAAGPNRHFHAGILWQIGNEIGIGYVAVELKGIAAEQGVDDIGRKFVTAF